MQISGTLKFENWKFAEIVIHFLFDIVDLSRTSYVDRLSGLVTRTQAQL